MNRPEEALHRSVAAYLNSVCPGLLWWTAANQRGTRSRFEMGVLKAIGVRAGVPDICIVTPEGRIAFVELKAERGTLSDAQKAFAAKARANRAAFYVCRSLADLEAVLDEIGIQRIGGLAA